MCIPSKSVSPECIENNTVLPNVSSFLCAKLHRMNCGGLFCRYKEKEGMQDTFQCILSSYSVLSIKVGRDRDLFYQLQV